MRKLKITIACSKCGRRHKKKECPVLLGRLLKVWDNWSRAYAGVRPIEYKKFHL